MSKRRKSKQSVWDRQLSKRRKLWDRERKSKQPVWDRELGKGIAYLLRTQLEDGTWFVRSRATIPLQAYFESGFPHGTDQFISAAGTSWAVIALAGER